MSMIFSFRTFNLYFLQSIYIFKCYGAYYETVPGKHLNGNEVKFNLKLLEVEIIHALDHLAYFKLCCIMWARNRSGG